MPTRKKNINLDKSRNKEKNKNKNISKKKRKIKRNSVSTKKKYKSKKQIGGASSGIKPMTKEDKYLMKVIIRRLEKNGIPSYNLASNMKAVAKKYTSELKAEKKRMEKQGKFTQRHKEKFSSINTLNENKVFNYLDYIRRATNVNKLRKKKI